MSSGRNVVATPAPSAPAGYLFHDPEPVPSPDRQQLSIGQMLARDVGWLIFWCTLAIAVILLSDLR